jgi:hypothetical protein
MSTVEQGHKCPSCGQVQTSGAPKVRGIFIIRHGDQEFHLPPLSLKGMRWARDAKIWEQLDAARAKSVNEMLQDDAVMGVIAKVIHQALTRNYPQIDIDLVEEMIDLENVIPALAATRGVTPEAAQAELAAQAQATTAQPRDHNPNAH